MEVKADCYSKRKEKEEITATITRTSKTEK
jgi:hypothetical protein